MDNFILTVYVTAKIILFSKNKVIRLLKYYNMTMRFVSVGTQEKRPNPNASLICSTSPLA